MQELKQEIIGEVEKAKSKKALDAVYLKYLGKKGKLTDVLKSLKNLSEEEKRKKGKQANQLKKEAGELIEKKKKSFHKKSGHGREWLDVTAPAIKLPQGHLHPLTLVQRRIEEIFGAMGFIVADGPEVENEHYNFDTLNIPKNHPARDLWDTFWLKDIDLLLRTHTSPVQVRYMEKNSPPLRIIVPGRCYRHEATDATHEAVFSQFECLMVGEDISVANFKAIILSFLKKFFGPQTEMRLIPSFFPFVEPAFQIDVKRSEKEGWLELLGAGMVHPNVFKAVGYKAGKWQGFAFGTGLERLAMIKYKIKDVRLLYDGDIRFLKQF